MCWNTLQRFTRRKNLSNVQMWLLLMFQKRRKILRNIHALYVKPNLTKIQNLEIIFLQSMKVRVNSKLEFPANFCMYCMAVNSNFVTKNAFKYLSNISVIENLHLNSKSFNFIYSFGSLITHDYWISPTIMRSLWESKTYPQDSASLLKCWYILMIV